MTTASMGHQAKLATSASSTVSQPFEFLSCDVGKRATILRRNGIRGTRSQIAEDSGTAGTYLVSGRLALEPSPEDLAIWLPRILGAAASSITYALAETIPDFVLGIDRIAKVFTYAGCKVDRATFSGSKGGLLTLSLDIEGLTESIGNAGTFPSLTISYTRPYVFSELVLTLASTAREVESFELVIDNALVKDRWMNTTTRVSLPEGDRSITLRTTHAFSSDNTDLYDQAIAGAAGTLAFTSGNYSTSCAFAKLQVPAEAPAVPGPNAEIMLTLAMQAYKSSTTNELIVTHDSTP